MDIQRLIPDIDRGGGPGYGFPDNRFPGTNSINLRELSVEFRLFQKAFDGATQRMDLTSSHLSRLFG